ncbi:MAG: hypothetical protein HC785_25865 [Calothrix sp. CSU_2_0]|nr:hypothetical protein [Calothrix sp. CSU_2_0]
MINKLLLPGSLLIALLSITGCGGTNSNSASVSSAETSTPTVTATSTTETTATSISQTSQPSPTSTPGDKQASKKLAAGTYCYSAKTKTLDAQAKLNISSTSKVDGTVAATIQNPEQSYYTSYNQTLTGNLVGDKAKLKIVTKIENDTQNRQETWTITESSLNTGRESFQKVDCNILTVTYEEKAIAQTGKPVQVKFAPGASSTTIKNSVVRSDRNTYLLGAKSGQQMNLKITSLENNAVFDVISPDGKAVEQEATTWSGKLPANGDYQIIVGGTRGNATYELTVEIK